MVSVVSVSAMRFLASALPVLGCTIVAGTAAAAGLPPLVSDGRNPVPACASPMRLTAYLKSRNPALDHRFSDIARHYMAEGHALRVRWDYAFFQMIVETASLTFRRPDGQPARVSVQLNNFAGLGLSERNAAPASFADVRSGVRAHLERLAREGKSLARAAAERTAEATYDRQAGLPGVGFADVAGRWAPETRAYVASIENVARKFYDGYCSTPEGARISETVLQTPAQPAIQSAKRALVKNEVRRTESPPASRTVAAGHQGTVAPAAPPAPKIEPPPAAPVTAAVAAPADTAPPAADGMLTGRVSLGAGDPDAPAEEPTPRFSLLAPRSILAALLPKSLLTTPEPQAQAEAIVEPAPKPEPIPELAPPPSLPPARTAKAAPAAPAVAQKPKPKKVASAPPPPAVPAKPAIPPQDEALHRMVTGKTVHLDTPVGTVIPISYKDDGTMQGEAGSLASYLGARIDHGKWWVANGQLCQKWTIWFDRDQVCMKLKQSGRVVHWSADNGKSGTARITDGSEHGRTRETASAR